MSAIHNPYFRTDHQRIEEHQRLIDPKWGDSYLVGAYAWNFRGGKIQITKYIPSSQPKSLASDDAKLMMHMELIDPKWAASCRLKISDVGVHAQYHLEGNPKARSGARDQDEKAVDGELKCIVCLENRRAVLVVPCNHLHVCNSCFSQWNTHCATCRTPVESHVVCYM